MDLGLKGKKVLIVGASKGIGKGISFGFASEGCRVVAISRTKELLDDLQKECLQKGAESFNSEVHDIMKEILLNWQDSYFLIMVSLMWLYIMSVDH